MNETAARILESITDAFFALDSEWRFAYINDQSERIMSRSRGDLLGRSFWDEFPATIGTLFERKFRRAAEEQTTIAFQDFYPPLNVWVEVRAYPSADGLSVFYQDITARKRSEGELRQFQFLADHAADAFFLLDAQGGFVYVNAAACRSLGYTPAEFQRMRAIDIDPVYDATTYQALFQRVDGERLPPFESLQRRADGTMLPIEASVSRLDIGGRPLLFSSCRDISERKAAERELRQAAVRQRAFLRDVLASVTEGRLILCQSEAELPVPLSPFSAPIPISMLGGLRDLRRSISDACQAVDLSDERCHDLITAASEAGMNAAVHAGEGIGQVFLDAQTDLVQVRITDHGPGISLENLPHATLRKGFTTAGTLGHGMKMMLQTADHVFLLTSPSGTRVVIEQERVAPPPVW
jgi:PAS domain S-box-containing protein